MIEIQNNECFLAGYKLAGYVVLGLMTIQREKDNALSLLAPANEVWGKVIQVGNG